jgi:nitroreductase
LIAETPAARAQWDAALEPANRLWATRAPVKLVLLGNPEEQPSVHGQERYLFDCGLALHGLLVQACAMGLAVRAMAGWNEDRARAAFDIPAPLRVVAFVAAGYPGNVEDFPVEVQQKEARPRVRKAPTELVIRDRFVRT